MILSNFPQIVQNHLDHLPQDDYPVLNTFKFVSIWLSFVLDQSQSSMRSLFKRLNIRGETVDISTFSKASKSRETQVFWKLFLELQKEVKKKAGINLDKWVLFPLDSTIIRMISSVGQIE